MGRTRDLAPQSAAPLSLQDKLDRISHDRKVLDVLRALMRGGLHEGDLVQHRIDGSRGRVTVIRTATEPEAVVILEDGQQLAFRPEDWAPRP
ncbi:MAG TPA: hypothetical protein VMK32_10285 [Burkholderiaceae bacterium]|nr:hypothetical protein [Burkholderiaceae bacterium]